MKILFVCTGNTCRSCMAEAAAQEISRRKQYSGNIFLSAGMAANEGAPASQHAVQAAAEWGADLNNHRARVLDEYMLQQADLVLTMSSTHKQFIVEYAEPGIKEKVFTLKEYAAMLSEQSKPDNPNIADPFGGKLEQYRFCLQEITAALEQILAKLH